MTNNFRYHLPFDFSAIEYEPFAGPAVLLKHLNQAVETINKNKCAIIGFDVFTKFSPDDIQTCYMKKGEEYFFQANLKRKRSNQKWERFLVLNKEEAFKVVQSFESIINQECDLPDKTGLIITYLSEADYA